MLTSRRMLSLLLAAAAVIAILSGCYAAPVSETTEQGGETSGAIVTDSEIPVMTYPVTEMNIQVLGNMTASAAKRTFTEGRPVCLNYSMLLSGVRYSEMSTGSPSAHRCSRS